jgi:hypothetical protein
MVNVGTLDRTLRVIIGVVLLISPFLPPLASVFAGWGAWKFRVAAVGLVLLGTAAFRSCPLYTLLGIRTCPLGKD